MCGIMGLVSREGPIDQNGQIGRLLCDLLKLCEIRGREAAGMAWMNQRRTAVFKRAKSASELIHDQAFRNFLATELAETRESFAVIGHARLMTNGDCSNPCNNQPAIYGNSVTVHNGIVVNDAELRTRWSELELKGRCDTELLTGLYELFRRECDSVTALRRVYREISGMSSTLILSDDRQSLLAATNNGSLYFCFSGDRSALLFASERIALTSLISRNAFARSRFRENDVQQLLPGQGLHINVRTAAVNPFNLNGGNEEVNFPEESRPGQIAVDEGATELPQPPPHISRINTAAFEIPEEPIRKLRRCSRCILPETMPFIEFDEQGVCNYCRTYEKRQYAGETEVRRVADRLRRGDHQPDSLVSFSGGRDSCYGLHYFVRELGLHPLAYSYDWGMVTDLARRNQSRLCEKLGIELITISADLRKKRENIRKNIAAWLKSPDLGMVPLFMAGDKQYFYYANQVCRNYRLDTILMAANPFEETHFKSGFCHVRPAVLRTAKANSAFERLPMAGVCRMGLHYLLNFLRNPAYINTSLCDTVGAALSYYIVPHNYFRLYNYIPWNEETVNRTLLEEYDWEISPDTESTWRIGDGTAPFYNYIYYRVAGFTENDTLRSNQIREGMLSREKALELALRDNRPRWESMKWYFDVIGMDMEDVLRRVQQISPLYADAGK